MTQRERRIVSRMLDMADFWGVTEYRPNSGRLPFDKFLDLSPYPALESEQPQVPPRFPERRSTPVASGEPPF